MFKKWIVLLVVLSCTIFAAGSGCSEDSENEASQEESNPVEGNQEDTGEEEEMEVEITSTGDTDEWCPAGASWQASDPQTGEIVTMEVKGTEVIDGVVMCRAVYESNVEDEEVAKVEYLWSEDGETVFWTAFDVSGNMVYKFSMEEGKVTVIDEEGEVMEMQQNP